MNKISLLLSFLCLSLFAEGQETFSIVSLSEKMNADVEIGKGDVEIDLFAKGEKGCNGKDVAVLFG